MQEAEAPSIQSRGNATFPTRETVQSIRKGPYSTRICRSSTLRITGTVYLIPFQQLQEVLGVNPVARSNLIH